MMQQKVVVVGAGPAGLMAAGQAAKQGAQVTLVDKMKRPARKLAITGKGRCNLTNITELPDFINHFGKNGRFLRQAFTAFFTDDLQALLAELGVETVVERGARVFPKSNRALDVVDALVTWAVGCGVVLKTASPVGSLLLQDKRVCGVRLSGGEQELTADAVVITTGGASYPATGSTGDGYRLAESAGHEVVPIRPALVPLETAGRCAAQLQGLSLRNVCVSIWFDGKKQGEQFGEMLFTHFGVSGPVILSLSDAVVDACNRGQKVKISIDLKPALDFQQLDARLLRDMKQHNKQQFKTLLKRLLPSSLIPVCMEQVGIAPQTVGHQITAQQRKVLKNWLKNFRLTVTGFRSWNEAIVTAGGVSLKEVNPRTMESRKVSGLYFAGEVLDLHADTGGYNLQAAFSTGYLAGLSVAQKQ